MYCLSVPNGSEAPLTAVLTCLLLPVILPYETRAGPHRPPQSHRRGHAHRLTIVCQVKGLIRPAQAVSQGHLTRTPFAAVGRQFSSRASCTEGLIRVYYSEWRW